MNTRKTSNGWDELDQDTYDKILAEKVGVMDGAAILQIPGVYEACSEVLNNEILAEWAERMHCCTECGRALTEGECPKCDS